MATMAAKRDYYEVLGVDRNATEAQVSEAYRKLALQYPPRPQSGRRRGRRQVQRGGRGLRGPQPSREAGDVRSLRPCRTGRGRRAALPRRLRHHGRLRRHFRRGVFQRFLRRPPGPRRPDSQGRRHPLRSPARLDRGRPRHVEDHPFHAARGVRDLRRIGGQARHSARGLPLLRRPRPGGAVERPVFAANRLPLLPRQRTR